VLGRGSDECAVLFFCVLNIIFIRVPFPNSRDKDDRLVYGKNITFKAFFVHIRTENVVFFFLLFYDFLQKLKSFSFQINE